MVRIIAGTLVEIGLGKRPVGDVQRLLAGDTSICAGQNAPPQGLCLMEVFY
jgi:tRNA pseudouridine38-40 synthase